MGTNCLSNYKICDLNKVVWFQEGPGVRKNQFRTSGVKLLNVGNICDRKLVLDKTSIYISEEEAYGKYKHFLVDEGDLLIASSGIKVEYFDKKITFAEKKHLPLCMNTSTIRFKVIDKDVLDINYFRYFLTSKYFTRQIQFHITGSAQLNFGPSHLNKMKIILPLISEQRRIAERLDKVQELIALQKEQLKKMDDLIKSRFIDLFGDPETNTKHWPLISWESLFSVVTGKLDANAMEENGKYPFFTCAKESFRINSYAFDQKALLLAGNNATADYDVKFYEGKFNAYQRTYVISLKNEQRSYIVYKFLLEQKLQLMKRLSKGTNTRYLTLSILKDFKFLDLPIPQQTQFADFVTKIEAQKGLLTTRLTHLETLYKSLMQEYFG